jgi:hypothetical protein
MNNPYQPPEDGHSSEPRRAGSKASIYATDAGMIAIIIVVGLFSRLAALGVAFFYVVSRNKIRDRQELADSSRSCPQCSREIGPATKICPRCNQRIDDDSLYAEAQSEDPGRFNWEVPSDAD